MIKALLRKREDGFTLVELMIVVAIIGVLAALAIYGVARYLKHSKTAEATRNLGSIETGSKNQFQLDTETAAGSNSYVHKFCPTSTIKPPSTESAPPPAKKVKAPAADWNDPAWVCLKFSINEPQFYKYSYTATGEGVTASYTALAEGDLDGNTTTSKFELKGSGSPTGDAQRVSLIITNEDE